MGVIRRQGIKHSIVTFAGIFLGMINVLFIYTYALTKTELGLIRYIISIATLVVPFISLGISSVAIRFFPDFKNEEKGHNGFLFFLLSIPLLGYFLFLLFFFFFQEEAIVYLAQKEDAELYLTYVPYSALLVIAITYAYLLVNYSANFKRITVPAIINDLMIKIALPTFSLLYFWGCFSFHTLIDILTIFYFFVPIGLFIYLWSLGELRLRPRFDFFDRSLMTEIRTYAGYRFLGVIGTIAATQIDVYMVGTLIDLGNAGVYVIALFIATVVGVPMKSLFSISAPIISDAWSRNDTVKIQEIYKKTSLTLLIFGIFLLVCIWSSIDYLFDIIPNGEEYRVGKYVVLILGLAKLVDMSCSVNTHIIAYSKLFRFDLYLSISLAILNIIFNLLLIPKYGIIGAALATLFSMTIFNAIKYLFVLIKFKMQPFRWEMLLILGLGVGLFFGTILIPDTNYSLLNIIINSLVILLIYVPAILYFNLSEDLTHLKQLIINKMKNFF